MKVSGKENFNTLQENESAKIQHINNVRPVVGRYLQLIGMGKNKTIKFLYLIPQVFFLLMIPVQIFSIISERGNAAKWFEILSEFFFCLVAAIKLFSIYTKFDKWYALVREIEDMEKEKFDIAHEIEEYDTEDEIDDQYQLYVDKYKRRFRNISRRVIWLYYLTLTTFCSWPFVEYFMRKAFLKEEILNYPIVIAYSHEFSNLYCHFLSIIFELNCAITTVVIHTVFDMMILAMMIFASGQFALIRDYSSNIGGRGHQCNISTKRDARAFYRIRKCHKIHVRLIKFVKNLDKLLNNLLGVYFITLTFILCAVAKQIKTGDLSVMNIVRLLQYTLGVLSQLVLYCYYGDSLIRENSRHVNQSHTMKKSQSSVGMGEGPFVAAWWCLSPRVRSLLLLLGIGMIKPRRLHAGLFYLPELPSLIQILRTAYSYYTVL